MYIIIMKNGAVKEFENCCFMVDYFWANKDYVEYVIHDGRIIISRN